MNSYWDQGSNNEESVCVEEITSNFNTYIKINGSNVEVKPGERFVDKVKEASINANFGKFRVFLNGLEIDPVDSPEFFEEGSKVEIRPYDVAG